MMHFHDLKDYLYKLNNLFHVMVAIPLLGFVYLYLESQVGRMQPLINNPDTILILHYILPLIIMVESGLAFIITKKSLSVFPNEDELRSKLSVYFRISLIKYAILEGAAIVSVVGYYLTLSKVYVVFYVVLLMIFSINRPTVYRISRDLKLEGEEKDIVVHKKVIS